MNYKSAGEQLRLSAESLGVRRTKAPTFRQASIGTASFWRHSLRAQRFSGARRLIRLPRGSHRNARQARRFPMLAPKAPHILPTTSGAAVTREGTSAADSSAEDRPRFEKSRCRQVRSKTVRTNAVTPAPSAGEITPPRVPIVRLPALDHALMVMGRHIEMHEIYSPVCSFRGEGEDQGRIRITVVKFDRAPGLDHEPLRDDLEHPASGDGPAGSCIFDPGRDAWRFVWGWPCDDPSIEPL